MKIYSEKGKTKYELRLDIMKAQKQGEIIEPLDMDKDVDYEFEEVEMVIENDPEGGQVLLDEFLKRYREGWAYAARWHKCHPEYQQRQDKNRKENDEKCLQ